MTVITATGNSAESRPAQARCQSEPRRNRWPAERTAGCGLPTARGAGFTLIEMLAVIVLIAVAVTVAAVTLHGRQRGQLQASIQQVAAGLRDTRTRAMTSGAPQWLTVNLQSRTWAIPGRAPKAFPAGAEVRVTSAAEDAGPAGGLASIRFFPDGSSSGGHIVLAEATRQVRVDVDWLTGAVTVESPR